ncbi:MAG TPA: hypothetical protein PLI43_16935 [Albidovulum sp.]|uniref:hypothetical protein n=1 Tax=Albidovulum sp. TaxID=1872424 RepID=UPI002CD4F099|nr:hypothetical protein [Albidovulum sp.]
MRAMRYILPVLSLAALAACQPPVPNDAAGGVGFGDYATYQKQREAELNAAQGAQTQTVQPPMVAGANPYGAPATGAPSASELAQAGIGGGQLGSAAAMSSVPPAGMMSAPIGELPAAEPVQAGPAVPPATTAAAPLPGAEPVQPESHSGISDEQDFSAVASRETIESDKARMEQNKAQYQQVQPTELPERSGDTGAAVDLVQYALNAPNRKGETIYPRSRIALANSERACGRYDTPEAAQQAFMRAGGPQKDSKNLDPDGDGFACFWDPTPFQKAKQ